MSLIEMLCSELIGSAAETVHAASSATRRAAKFMRRSVPAEGAMSNGEQRKFRARPGGPRRRKGRQGASAQPGDQPAEPRIVVHHQDAEEVAFLIGPSLDLG